MFFDNLCICPEFRSDSRTYHFMAQSLEHFASEFPLDRLAWDAPGQAWAERWYESWAAISNRNASGGRLLWVAWWRPGLEKPEFYEILKRRTGNTTTGASRL
jgi:hypothetical protein